MLNMVTVFKINHFKDNHLEIVELDYTTYLLANEV